MPRLIRGDRLTPKQIEQVFAAFVHRSIAIGPTSYYRNDWAWLFDHAFYFVKDGSRLARNRRYCETATLAEEN